MLKSFIISKRIMLIIFCFMNISLSSAYENEKPLEDTVSYYHNDSTFVYSDKLEMVVKSHSTWEVRTYYYNDNLLLKEMDFHHSSPSGNSESYTSYDYDSIGNVKGGTNITELNDDGQIKTIKYYNDTITTPNNLVRTMYCEYDKKTKLLTKKTILLEDVQKIRKIYSYDSNLNLKKIKVRWVVYINRCDICYLQDTKHNSIYLTDTCEDSGRYYTIDYDINNTSEANAIINQARKQNINIADIRMEKYVKMRAFNLRGQMIPFSHSLTRQTGNIRINNTAGITILHARGQNEIMPIKHISVR